MRVAWDDQWMTLTVGLDVGSWVQRGVLQVMFYFGCCVIVMEMGMDMSQMLRIRPFCGWNFSRQLHGLGFGVVVGSGAWVKRYKCGLEMVTSGCFLVLWCSGALVELDFYWLIVAACRFPVPRYRIFIIVWMLRWLVRYLGTGGEYLPRDLLHFSPFLSVLHRDES